MRDSQVQLAGVSQRLFDWLMAVFDAILGPQPVPVPIPVRADDRGSDDRRRGDGERRGR